MIVIQPGITGGLAEYSGHGGRDENDPDMQLTRMNHSSLK